MQQHRVILLGTLVFLFSLGHTELAASYGGSYGDSPKSSISGSPKPQGRTSLSNDGPRKALLKAAEALNNGWRCPECVVGLQDAGAPDSVIAMVRSDLENGRVNKQLAAELEKTAQS